MKSLALIVRSLHCWLQVPMLVKSREPLGSHQSRDRCRHAARASHRSGDRHRREMAYPAPDAKRIGAGRRTKAPADYFDALKGGRLKVLREIE